MRNLAIILPLKSKLSGKFQRFNAIDESIDMLKNVEFRKISVEMKNCKTFYETQTLSRLKEIIRSPPHPILQDKNLITFFKRNKIFF